MIARQEMINTIKDVYERYGFVPIDTPAIEALEVLTGQYGETSEMDIFQFMDPDKSPAGLRFDLTVPLARIVAMYPELPKPFKRYHVASVWRADKPEPGRYREFIQFDADIVGTSSMSADTEIISVMHDTMVSLGITRFLIKVNDRKILNSLINFLRIDPFFTNDIFRVLDKLDRIGPDEVRKKLMQEGDSGIDQREVPAEARCIGLSGEVTEKILEFVAINGSNNEIIEKLGIFFSGFSPAAEGINELSQIVRSLQKIGLPEERYRLDLSIARGLAYYTGPVFETTLLDLPGIGSVFSGGRFDELVGRFTEQPIPATGASIGVDRLFAALEQLKLITLVPSKTQVLVTVFKEQWVDEYQLIARELRQAGFNTELYMGSDSLGRQFRYADLKKIPVVIIAGPDELSQDEVSIKNLTASFGQENKQQRIKRSELVPFIRTLLVP
jgi:histidyl-tRNA synthetase